MSDEPRWRIILVRCASPRTGCLTADQAEVSQPDLGEGVDEVLQPGEQRGHRRLVDASNQSARSLVSIEQTSAMFFPLIFDDRASARAGCRHTRDRS